MSVVPGGPFEIVELRVHGVSGSPPAQLLHYPSELVELCYGDDNVGFYRRSDDSAVVTSDDPDSPTPRPAGLVSEAFSWGHLTSGPATRALWLLFLPFVLVNLAHWMLPPTEVKPSRWASWSVRLLRVFGLTLSVTLLFAMMSVLVDLVGWQCPDLPQCSDRLGPLRVLSGWTPGMRLAATAAPVLAVVAVLLLIGKPNPRIGEPPPDAAKRGTSPLTNPNFWNGDPSVSRLRACHMTVWFSTVAALVLAASWTITGTSPRTPTAVLLVVHLVFVLAGLVFTFWDRVTARGGRGLRRDQSDRTHSWPQWMWLSSMALSIASLGWVFGSHWYAGHRNPGSKIAVHGPLPYLPTATRWLIGVQLLLLLALLVATWLSRRSAAHLPSDYRPTLRGLTAPCVATLAWLIGGEASVAVGFWVSRYLGQPVGSAEAAAAVTQHNADALRAASTSVIGMANPANDATESSSKMLRDFVNAANGQAPLQLSAVYFVASMVNLVVIAAVIIMAVTTAVLTWHRGRTRILQQTWSDYGDAEKEGKRLTVMRTARARAISDARAWAALTDHVPVLLASVIVVAVVAGAIFSTLVPSWLGGATVRSGWTAVLLTGQGVTAFVATAAVGLAYKAFRSSETRRRVAVMWDVVTFWPRAAHPLGPPCYGERAVPDLWLRSTLLARESKVVMAAHSQGSVIGAAALLINAVPAGEAAAAPAETSLLSRPVAVLTFGCPLRRLYARNFPAYFGFDTLELLKAQATGTSSRWVNLWALTDPIGGWVLTEDLGPPPVDTPTGNTVDRRLLDATALEPVNGRYPPICGHSGFWTRREYAEALAALTTRIVQPPAPPVPAPPSPTEPTPFRLPAAGE